MCFRGVRGGRWSAATGLCAHSHHATALVRASASSSQSGWSRSASWPSRHVVSMAFSSPCADTSTRQRRSSCSISRHAPLPRACPSSLSVAKWDCMSIRSSATTTYRVRRRDEADTRIPLLNSTRLDIGVQNHTPFTHS